MADTVSMSLDDYIKQKKIRRPGNPNKKVSVKAKRGRVGVALKTKRLQRNAKLRVSAKRATLGVGGLRRGGRGRGGGVNRNNKQRRELVYRTSGFRYFNSQNVGASSYKRSGFGRSARGGRARLSMAARRQLLQQSLQPGAGPIRNLQRIRANAKRRGLAVRNNRAKTRLMVAAQQRLKKARALLAARRRILGANSVAATSTVSGRILFSKFGLLTTQRRNAQENMISIQEKIQRAQLARGQLRQPIPALLQSPARPRQSPGRGRAGNRSRAAGTLYSPPPRSYRESTVEFAPPSFYSGGAVGSSSGSLYSDRMLSNAPLRSRQMPVDDDDWVQRQRRIANTSYSSRQSSIMVDRFQQEPGPSSTYLDRLDPEIQNRISHIQQAGRRRREEPDRSLVIPDYRGPVSSSRMLLGERFKRLQR